MLSVVEEHIREISALKISTCGNFLATGSLDGAVKIFSVARFSSLLILTYMSLK
jgi:WD40 repeat protein